MAVEFDNIHYSYRAIDGYNKPFNFVLSPRELGKTATMWYEKIYLGWKKDKKPWIYLVRKAVEITDALINSIADTIINKFTDDNVTFSFKSGSFKDGIVDVKIGDELFFRVVSLNIDMRRIKLAVLKNIKGVFMDEYVINPEMGEKYLPKEAEKLKEAYTTWRRECDGLLRFYIVGNPYSLFNPLYVDWKVDTSRLHIGEFYVGDTFVIHYPALNEKLYNWILEHNPLFKLDKFYQQYALEGVAVNDSNIKLGKLPPHYSLRFVFHYQRKNIGIFQNNRYDGNDNKYFIQEVSEVSASRVMYCFDFEDLVERAVVMSLDERFKLQRFKEAFRKREVVFGDINCYYFIKEIYKNI